MFVVDNLNLLNSLFGYYILIESCYAAILYHFFQLLESHNLYFPL